MNAASKKGAGASRARALLGAALPILLCGALLAAPSAGFANGVSSGFSTTPVTNQGKPWRLAYYQGGQTGNYYEYLRAVVGGMMSLGWIEERSMPNYPSKDSKQLWAWLAQHAGSKYVTFAPDAFYSAGWDQQARVAEREKILDRLREEKDVDLVFAMGTWAGKDLATDEHSVPTIVMSASDPVRSGIIESVHDSGRAHIHARVDPLRYERQIRVFHDVIEFRTLGVAYEDSPDGRAYAAMDTVERMAEERGFEIVRCFTKSDVANQKVANKSVLDCFEQLSEQVDAIYLTQQGGVNPTTIPELVKIANESRVPTFSQSGAKEVSYGVLLSISRPSFKPVGIFLAATAAKVLNGAKPGSLPQLYEEAPSIAINLKTAEVIGLYLYADVLAAADQIYRDIRVQ